MLHDSRKLHCTYGLHDGVVRGGVKLIKQTNGDHLGQHDQSIDMQDRDLHPKVAA